MISIKSFLDEGSVVQEFNLLDQVGLSFWHSNIIDKNGVPIGSGFGESQTQSRKIAFAEMLERKSFREIKSSSTEIQKNWGVDIISTGCGFAAGFDLRNSIIRSLGEALERWVMSKWIDDDLYLEEICMSDILNSLDRVSLWFLCQFDSVRFFKKEILVVLNNNFIRFSIGICVGLKDSGAYPGSFYCAFGKSDWQHALLECYRHVLLVKNTVPTNTFPDNKVRFFSKNAHLAIMQIDRKKFKMWGSPEIIFSYNQKMRGFYLARTIINGWRSWNSGSLQRFLY